jgi:hypothetical protein
MSIFCHPLAFTTGSALRSLLNTQAPERLQFGYKPRVPLRLKHVERTEMDLRVGELMLEAKLTENDFQSAPQARVRRYRDFEYVFDSALLPALGDTLLHYQLIRGVLSAFAEEGMRYCVVCDSRRPDLIEAWFSVVRAVKAYELRSRLQLVTWQEISSTLPTTMRAWLEEKYGICSGPGGGR